MNHHIAAFLRQGLLLHEIVRSCNKPQAPIVGPAIPPQRLAEFSSNPRGLVAWLREQTLALRNTLYGSCPLSGAGVLFIGVTGSVITRRYTFNHDPRDTRLAHVDPDSWTRTQAHRTDD